MNRASCYFAVMHNMLFVYFFGGLECVSHPEMFAAACRRATNLANQLPT
jgi:hypothetical protein